MQSSRLIKWAVVVFIAADALFLLAVKSPARLVGLAAVGRSGCAFDGTLQSFQNTKQHFQLKEYFERNSRILKHDPGGLELWETPRGQFWMPNGDHSLPLLLAEQELKIYGSGIRGVHANSVVLDCGANVGTFTKTALASGAKLVVAIEPAPLTLECLRRNLAQEITQSRVIVYPKGVWDHDDFLTLAVDDGNAGTNSLVLGLNRSKSTRVPLTTIDKIVAELKLDRVDFIKMDIEGSEKRALAGARETLKRFVPKMAISSEHLPDDAEKIPQVVKNIRPEYAVAFADCQDEGNRVKPLVLQFF